MTPKPVDPWAEWMAAEQARDDERADRALGTAMRRVNRYQPGPALSERLLATAAVQRPVVTATSERLVVAGVIGGALAMTLLPVSVIALFVVTDAGRIVSLVARGCVWVAEWLNAGVSLWTVLGRTGQALGQATGSPTVSLVLTVALLAASSALLVLNRYLPVERS
jgi:hypothetical protein